MSALAPAAARLRTGTARAYRARAARITAWAAAGRRPDLEGWQAALGSWLRLGLVAAAGYGAYWACRTWPWLMWLAAVWLLLTAWRAGRPDREPAAVPGGERPGKVEEQPAAEGEAGPVAPAPAPPAPGPSLDTVLAAARELGTPHVHLAAIEAHIKAPRGSVRPVLVEAGIRIKDVRMDGRGSSTGVRGADIPPPATPLGDAAVGVVGAGQGANNNTNNADGAPFREGPEGGYPFRVEDDPANPARAHVIHH